MPAKTRFDVPAMRREFLATNITLRALAEKHGCSYRYVSGLSSTKKWYPKRRELQRQQEAAATDALGTMRKDGGDDHSFPCYLVISSSSVKIIEIKYA